MPLPDPSPTGDIYYAFLSILLEGAPYILLGALLSGFIDAFLPANLMDRLLPKKAGPAILISGLLGIILPVCECAIVPVIRRLVQKGLPLGCAMTYMLAAPIVNPIVMLSTWTAFRGRQPVEMTCWRVILGYGIAVLAGLLMSKLPASTILRKRVLDGIQPAAAVPAEGEAVAPPVRRTKGQGLVHALLTAQRDFVDTAMYFVIGVGIASIFSTQLIYRPALQEEMSVLANNHWLAAPLLMATAFILSLCSTTDAFIIAADNLFPAVAKLAFLVFGPMMDMKLVFLYSTVMKPKAVVIMAIALFIAVYVACLGLESQFSVTP